MILGLLAERGPMHGHQIRRAGELANVEAWGGITGGALYSELRKLDSEGLISPVTPGVRPYALDPEHAKALWTKSEEMVRERF